MIEVYEVNIDCYCVVVSELHKELVDEIAKIADITPCEVVEQSLEMVLRVDDKNILLRSFANVMERKDG